MLQFLNKLLGFFILILCFGALALVSSNYYIDNFISSFKISDEKTTLFLGHSHSECSYNDSIIPNSINVSNSGEAYFYTYLKLRSILKNNSHIERIFVEFTNNQILEDKNLWTWDKTHISRFFPSLSHSCDVHDLAMLVKNSPKNLLVGFQNSLQLNLKRMTLNSYKYKINNFGQFKSHDVAFKEKINPSSETKDLSIISGVNMHYLQKIIELAEEKKVEINFIRSPIWKSNFALKNEATFQHIRNSRFKAINFIDFKDFFGDTTYFRDSGHLNKVGATELSVYFKNNFSFNTE